MPLSKLRVVALEQAVAAPFCSRQLADLGADVIKIERPDGGDSARSLRRRDARDVGVLRLAQSRQAQRRARPQDARRSRRFARG